MAGPRKPYVVGIVGGSASGKTSFLRALAQRLPAGTCSALSQDNYYRPLQEQERDADGQPNFDLPNAIQRDRLHADLCALVRGETITLTEYTFNQRSRQGAQLTVFPAAVLLLEGLFLFHYEEIRTMLDLRVFIDAGEELRRQRRLERDLRQRGYPTEHVEYQWQHHVLPAYRQFILPYREEAHLVVANHLGFDQGLEMVIQEILANS